MGDRTAHTDGPDGFRLEPVEGLLLGVRLRRGRLSIGPGGTDRLFGALLGALALVLGSALAIGRIPLVTEGEAVVHAAAQVVAGLAVAAAGVVAAASILARRVRADGGGLQIRTIAGTRRVPWSDVADVRAAVQHHRRTWLRGAVAVGRDGAGLGRGWEGRPVVLHWQLGQVALTDGSTIELWGTRSPHRLEGYVGPQEPTTAERKVNLLRRYRTAATGEDGPVEPNAPVLVVLVPPTLWWQPFLGTVFLWLAWAFSSWAVGGWRDPILPVLTTMLLVATAALTRSLRRASLRRRGGAAVPSR